MRMFARKNKTQLISANAPQQQVHTDAAGFGRLGGTDRNRESPLVKTSQVSARWLLVSIY